MDLTIFESKIEIILNFFMQNFDSNYYSFQSQILKEKIVWACLK